MPLGMYESSVPVFSRMLKNLSAILDKAQAHAEAKKIDPSALLTARLYPDMFPLARQVQEATKHVTWACALLSGGEKPDYPIIEGGFDDLKRRIAEAIEFAQSFKPEQFEGSEERRMILKLTLRTLDMPGRALLTNFSLPNFYFHMTTAYGILRHCGVEIGKLDFMGRS